MSADDLHPGRRKVKVRGKCINNFSVSFALCRRSKHPNLVLFVAQFFYPRLPGSRLNFDG